MVQILTVQRRQLSPGAGFLEDPPLGQMSTLLLIYCGTVWGYPREDTGGVKARNGGSHLRSQRINYLPASTEYFNILRAGIAMPVCNS